MNNADKLFGVIAASLADEFNPGCIQRRIEAFVALRDELSAGYEPDWLRYPQAAEYVQATMAHGLFARRRPRVPVQEAQEAPEPVQEAPEPVQEPPEPVQEAPADDLKTRLVEAARLHMLLGTDQASEIFRRLRDEALRSGLSQEQVYSLSMDGFQKAT